MLEWTFSLLIASALSASYVLTLRRQRRRALAAAALGLGGIGIGAAVLGADLGVQKLVSWLVMPVGLLWMMLWALCLTAFAQRARAILIGLVAAFAFLSVIGNIAVGQWLLRTLEQRVPDVELDGSSPRFDAVFVPGGGAGFIDGRPQLYDHGDRTLFAARLYLGGRTERLVATGSAIASLSDANDLAEATSLLWESIGVPRGAIIRIPEPKNTSQEVVAFKALVEREGWTRLGVVGSAWHLPRILALSERAGLTLVPLKADRRGGTIDLHPALMVPQSQGIRSTQLAAWEYLGRWVGR